MTREGDTSNNGDEARAEMPNTPNDGASIAPREYAVGYRRPPQSTRFKPGKSGNPKGRKKRAPNVTQQIEALLAQKIRVTESGKHKSLSRQQVMLTSIANNASKGDLKSAAFLLHLRATHREEKSSTIDPALLDAESAALLSSFVAQMLAGEEIPQEGATSDEIPQRDESKPSGSTSQHGQEVSTGSATAASAAGETEEHGRTDSDAQLPNADGLAGDLSSAQAEFSTGPIDSDRNLLPGQNQTRLGLTSPPQLRRVSSVPIHPTLKTLELFARRPCRQVFEFSPMTKVSREERLAIAARDPRLVAALLRSNFAVFVHKVFLTLNPGGAFLGNWHIFAIAWHLDQVLSGRIRRLVIAMPPRSLKSISASVAFPAFIHALHPEKHIISVTYGQELSVKLHNDYRTVLGTDWYRAAFPNTCVDPRKDTENEVVLTRRGSRLATSIGGTLTGRGADVIIIDDPLKPSDGMSKSRREAVNDWYGTTLVSRLNDKTKGAIVIVTQRVHSHDLVGHVLETAPTEWTVLNLPAIATADELIRIHDRRAYRRHIGEILHPQREPGAVLNRLRSDIGSDAFEAQYQQAPVPPGGAMFKRAWIRRYDILPRPLEDDEIIQSWDTASKSGPANDWSVCTTWLVRQGQYFLIDVFRGKLDYPDLKTSAVGLAEAHSPRMVLVEETGVGIGLVAELRNLGVNVSPVCPDASKEARAAMQSAKFEGGRVLFPERAPWLAELEAELFSFPGSRYDDQIDSIVQALAYEPEPSGGVIWLRFGRRAAKD